MNQEFRLKKVDKIKNYLIKEMNQNELISKKHKKVCKVLNYTEHLLNAISTIIGCVFISAFASLVAISIGITSSEIEVKTCIIKTGLLLQLKSQGVRRAFHQLACMSNHWTISHTFYSPICPVDEGNEDLGLVWFGVNQVSSLG